MYKALNAAFIKLRDYYRETDNIRGDLYAIGAMLAPANKFHFFSTDDWDDKWRERYRRNFKEYLSPYQERLASRQNSATSQGSTRLKSRLDIMLGDGSSQLTMPKEEMIQYLDSGMSYDSLIFSSITNQI
jgi:hypothetical protein